MSQLVKTFQGLAIASVKTTQGLAIASAKTIMGVDNTGGVTPDILNEDFETSGTPSGWAAPTGTADYDYSAAPLAGSQSLRCPASSTGKYNSGGALNNAEIWGKLLFKVTTLPSAAQVIIKTDQEFVANGAGVYLNTDGTILAWDGGGVYTSNSVDAMSTGTIYNIWFHFKKDPGGFTGIVEASFDIAGNSRPNSGNKHVISNIAQFTATMDVLYIGFYASLGSDAVAVYDNVQVSSTDIF